MLRRTVNLNLSKVLLLPGSVQQDCYVMQYRIDTAVHNYRYRFSVSLNRNSFYLDFANSLSILLITCCTKELYFIDVSVLCASVFIARQHTAADVRY